MDTLLGLLRTRSRLALRLLQNLGLRSKFSLLLLLVLVIGSLASWGVLSQVLLKRAEAQVASESQALIETMSAVREYTARRISPLLETGGKTRPDFVPETIPAYSARKVFEYMLEEREDGFIPFLYKEATPNARYGGNLADDFEANLLEYFRSEREIEELSGFRTRTEERLFYTARPLVLKQESCLRCHTDPALAPESLIAVYGSERAFGLELGDVIAVQVVYVSAEEVVDISRVSLSIVMPILLIVFVFAVVLINILLNRWVVKPIGQMAKMARLISDDEMDTEAFDLDSLTYITERTDELGQSAQVFQSMAHEVYSREKRLKQDVKRLLIKVDETKRRQHVAEITESDYFKELQKKVRSTRGKSRESGKED